MVTYEQSEKILFSADGFGTFGSLDANEEWIAEARKYYINIVGKYGNPVQALLKKCIRFRHSDDLPAAWTCLKRKPWLLY